MGSIETIQQSFQRENVGGFGYATVMIWRIFTSSKTLPLTAMRGSRSLAVHTNVEKYTIATSQDNFKSVFVENRAMAILELENGETSNYDKIDLSVSGWVKAIKFEDDTPEHWNFIREDRVDAILGLPGDFVQHGDE